MWRKICILMGLCLSIGLYADKLFIENFDYTGYTLPDSLGVVDGWNYFSDDMLGQWSENVACDTLLPEAGLVYNGFTDASAKFNIASAGYVCKITSPGGGFHKKMTPTTADVVYVSMLVSVQEAPTNAGGCFFALTAGEQASWLECVARVAVRWDATTKKMAFGISEREYYDGLPSYWNYSDYVYDLDTVYMLNVQYERNTRRATLYINPVKATQLGTQIAQYQTTKDVADRPKIESLQYVWLYGGKTSMPSAADHFSLKVDAIRVADTNIIDLYNDKLPAAVPEIDVPTTLNFGSLDADGEYTMNLVVSGSSLTDDIVLSCDNKAIRFSTDTVRKENAMREGGDTVQVVLQASGLTGSEEQLTASVSLKSTGAITHTVKVSWIDLAYQVYEVADLAALQIQKTAAATAEKSRVVLLTGSVEITRIPTDTTPTLFYMKDTSMEGIEEFYYTGTGAETGMLDKVQVGSKLINLKLQIVGERGAQTFTPLCITMESPDLQIDQPSALSETTQNNLKIAVQDGLLTVELEKENIISGSIYDVQGHLLQNSVLQGNVASFKVRSLPQGIFIVSIETAAGQLYRQTIIWNNNK